MHHSSMQCGHASAGPAYLQVGVSASGLLCLVRAATLCAWHNKVLAISYVIGVQTHVSWGSTLPIGVGSYLISPREVFGGMTEGLWRADLHEPNRRARVCVCVSGLSADVSAAHAVDLYRVAADAGTRGCFRNVNK